MTPSNYFFRLCVFFFLCWLPFSGCECVEEPPVTIPKPEIAITPSGGWVITQEVLPGLKKYQKFTISNKANQGAAKLVVDSIVLKITSGKEEFKMITDQCPLDAEKNPDCVPFPSLPFSLEVGQTKSFTVQYTASQEVGFKSAKITIVSNTKNSAEKDKSETEFNVQTAGAKPFIDVSLQSVGATKLVLPLKRTAKGKPISETFYIKSVGNADLQVSLSFTKEEADFKVTDDQGVEIIGKTLTLAPGSLQGILVTHTPSKCGGSTASLKITSNASARAQTADTGVSGPSLTIDISGSSPTEGLADKQLVDFGEVEVNQSKTESFNFMMSGASLCDLEVKSIALAGFDGGALPASFKITKMMKDGKEVQLPTTLAQNEKITVEIEYAPTTKESAQAIIIMDTNDPAIPKNQAIVTLTAGTKKNLPPFPDFKVICDQGQSPACTKGADITFSTLYLQGEKLVQVKLDASKSMDSENAITKYEWKLETPQGSSTVINDPTAKETWMKIDSTGTYKITLTVTDDFPQSRSKPIEFKVNN